jgi:hypothetical protein
MWWGTPKYVGYFLKIFEREHYLNIKLFWLTVLGFRIPPFGILLAYSNGEFSLAEKASMSIAGASHGHSELSISGRLQKNMESCARGFFHYLGRPRLRRVAKGVNCTRTSVMQACFASKPAGQHKEIYFGTFAPKPTRDYCY